MYQDLSPYERKYQTHPQNENSKLLEVSDGFTKLQYIETLHSTTSEKTEELHLTLGYFNFLLQTRQEAHQLNDRPSFFSTDTKPKNKLAVHVNLNKIRKYAKDQEIQQYFALSYCDVERQMIDMTFFKGRW